MAVVPLTLSISLCLVFTFVIFFLREHARGRFSSAERDSLLPLAEEGVRVAAAGRADAEQAAFDADHPTASNVLKATAATIFLLLITSTIAVTRPREAA